MTTIVEDIISGIEGVCASVLTSFTKATFCYELSRNILNVNKMQYSVTSDQIEETKTATNYVSYLQVFSIHLQGNYLQDSNNDDAKRSMIATLQSSAEAVLQSGLKSQFAVPSSIVTCSNFTIDLPQIDTQSKTIYLKTSFYILYRVSI